LRRACQSGHVTSRGQVTRSSHAVKSCGQVTRSRRFDRSGEKEGACGQAFIRAVFPRGKPGRAATSGAGGRGVTCHDARWSRGRDRPASGELLELSRNGIHSALECLWRRARLGQGDHVVCQHTRHTIGQHAIGQDTIGPVCVVLVCGGGEM